MMKFSGKGFKRAGRNNKKMDRMDKTFSSISIAYLDLMVINYLKISIDKLPKIKDEAHVINLDDKQSKGTHRVSYLIIFNLIRLCTLIFLELNIFLNKY